MLPLMRPQELLAAHATDALLRRIAAVTGSPRTGASTARSIPTGSTSGSRPLRPRPESQASTVGSRCRPKRASVS